MRPSHRRANRLIGALDAGDAVEPASETDCVETAQCAAYLVSVEPRGDEVGMAHLAFYRERANHLCRHDRHAGRERGVRAAAVHRGAKSTKSARRVVPLERAVIISARLLVLLAPLRRAGTVRTGRAGTALGRRARRSR